MNKDQIKGKAKQVEGEIKDRAGGALGDHATKAEGKVEKVVGKVQEAYGNAKEDLDNSSTDRAGGRRSTDR